MTVKLKVKSKLQCSRCGIYQGDIAPEIRLDIFSGHEVHCCADCWEWLIGKTEENLSYTETHDSYRKIIPTGRRWFDLDKFIVL